MHSSRLSSIGELLSRICLIIRARLLRSVEFPFLYRASFGSALTDEYVNSEYPESAPFVLRARKTDHRRRA